MYSCIDLSIIITTIDVNRTLCNFSSLFIRMRVLSALPTSAHYKSWFTGAEFLKKMKYELNPCKGSSHEHPQFHNCQLYTDVEGVHPGQHCMYNTLCIIYCMSPVNHAQVQHLFHWFFSLTLVFTVNFSTVLWEMISTENSLRDFSKEICPVFNISHIT